MLHTDELCTITLFSASLQQFLSICDDYFILQHKETKSQQVYILVYQHASYYIDASNRCYVL